MNYGNMMKQAKQMQKKMQQIQEELKKTEFEASSGGGAVKVKVNGEQEVLEVKINQEMVDADDLEMVEDMVVVAINDAHVQIQTENAGRNGRSDRGHEYTRLILERK
ncbi:MAG: YbaB/EbfC family nucleoid-associated protein [Actinomycetota bacterium]|nr:YbaB/EbfC family nucleoid-associated protein [Actinomycetota bacterium]